MKVEQASLSSGIIDNIEILKYCQVMVFIKLHKLMWKCQSIENFSYKRLNIKINQLLII